VIAVTSADGKSGFAAKGLPVCIRDTEGGWQERMQ